MSKSTIAPSGLGSGTMSRHSRLFLLLSFTGFLLLWIVMAANGTISAMIDAVASGTLPDGRPLKLSYIGIPLVDQAISTVVAFFEPVTNGISPGPRLLMVAFMPSLQSAIIWVLIEGLRVDSNMAM